MKIIMIDDDVTANYIATILSRIKEVGDDIIIVGKNEDLPEELKMKLKYELQKPIEIKPFELPDLQKPIINEMNSPIPDKYVPKHKTKK